MKPSCPSPSCSASVRQRPAGQNRRGDDRPGGPLHHPAVLHGGAIMAFADTLGAMGTIVNLPQGAGTTTIESKTNFVAPAPVGTRVIGEATPVHRGRRTMIWQTRISTAEGRLVALVTQTQLVL